jgi:hypothetical protein
MAEVRPDSDPYTVDGRPWWWFPAYVGLLLGPPLVLAALVLHAGLEPRGGWPGWLWCWFVFVDLKWRRRVPWLPQRLTVPSKAGAALAAVAAAALDFFLSRNLPGVFGFLVLVTVGSAFATYIVAVPLISRRASYEGGEAVFAIVFAAAVATTVVALPFRPHQLAGLQAQMAGVGAALEVIWRSLTPGA